jgi:hypothetical protein
MNQEENFRRCETSLTKFRCRYVDDSQYVTKEHLALYWEASLAISIALTGAFGIILDRRLLKFVLYDE